ncbi:retrotransposon protein, putative, ty1-copia subclass [Tanacetum coccineum]
MLTTSISSSSSTTLGSTTRLDSVELGPLLFIPVDNVPSKSGAQSSRNGNIRSEGLVLSSRGFLMLSKPVETTTHVSLVSDFTPGPSSGVRAFPSRDRQDPPNPGLICMHTVLTKNRWLIWSTWIIGCISFSRGFLILILLSAELSTVGNLIMVGCGAVRKSHIVLGIAPVAIIDRRLPFEYTITSRSTDVVVPLPAAPADNSEANVLLEWNAIYDAYNEVACLILGKKGKPVAAYVIKMKDYVDQLERLGSMLPQDLVVGLILNGLTKDFAGFVRNYNMHNMGKTIGELHAMLIEYEKGLPKKAETPQVMMIKGGKIQKANKKSLKAKGKGKANGKGKDKQVYIPKPKNPKPSAKEHLAKDDACHHCKEVGHWKRNCHVYLAELLKKKKQVGSASSLGKMTRKLFPHRPERAIDLLGIIHTDVCGPLRHVSRQGASYFITFTGDYSRYGYVYLLKHKHELTHPYTPPHNGVYERRNRTLLDMVRSMMNLTTLPLSFWDYALESATRILNMVPTKKVDKTPYELWYGKVPNLSYLKVWGCEALVKRDTPDKL